MSEQMSEWPLDARRRLLIRLFGDDFRRKLVKLWLQWYENDGMLPDSKGEWRVVAESTKKRQRNDI